MSNLTSNGHILWWNENIFLLFAGIFAPPALIGNTLYIVIIITRNLRNKSIYRYLAAVLLADSLVTVAFVLETIKKYLSDLLTEDLYLHIYCRVFYVLLFGCGNISSWLLVAVTVDRYMCITYPTKFNFISKSSTVNIILFCITAFFVILECQFVYLFGSVQKLDNSTLVCVPRNNFSAEYIQKYLSYPEIFFYSILPSSILIVLNSLMIKNLAVTLKNRGSMMSSVVKENKKHRRLVNLLLTGKFFLFLSSSFIKIINCITIILISTVFFFISFSINCVYYSNATWKFNNVLRGFIGELFGEESQTCSFNKIC